LPLLSGVGADALACELEDRGVANQASVAASISATMIRSNLQAFSEWVDPDALKDVLEFDLSGL
jgi:hypothetical protein